MCTLRKSIFFSWNRRANKQAAHLLESNEAVIAFHSNRSIDIYNVKCFVNALPSFKVGNFGSEGGKGKESKEETGKGRRREGCESLATSLTRNAEAQTLSLYANILCAHSVYPVRANLFCSSERCRVALPP